MKKIYILLGILLLSFIVVTILVLTNNTSTFDDIIYNYLISLRSNNLDTFLKIITSCANVLTTICLVIIILLVIKDKSIIGYLYYSDIYERIEINQIEINSSYRNKGYGSKLLKYLIDNTNKSITLEVRKDNKPAISLYKKYGFKEVAIRKNYYDGIDGILMERE